MRKKKNSILPHNKQTNKKTRRPAGVDAICLWSPHSSFPFFVCRMDCTSSHKHVNTCVRMCVCVCVCVRVHSRLPLIACAN
jgi:hypothetical protein